MTTPNAATTHSRGPSGIKQTLAVLVWLLLPLLSLILFSLSLYWIYTRPLAVAYLVWILVWDNEPYNGGRPSSLMRRLPLWTWMVHLQIRDSSLHPLTSGVATQRDFFPVILIKESEIDPTRNYVFGYHPHGIFGLGAVVNFGTESNKFSDLFPGIQLRLTTLTNNFKLPIYREILMSLFFVSVDRRSCSSILKQGPGHSVCIVVGGAQESLYAQPGCLDLVLNKRMGFIKIAVLNGYVPTLVSTTNPYSSIHRLEVQIRASLVPVLSIGENELYTLVPTSKGTFAYHIQQAWKRITGWTLPVFFGRGLFIPYRRQIATIVCNPIHPHLLIDKPVDTLSPEQLDRICRLVHQAYVKVLTETWDKYKDQYAPDRIKELQIVE